MKKAKSLARSTSQPVRRQTSPPAQTLSEAQRLAAALAPRQKGKQSSLESRLKQLEKELEAALRQCARQEALVRVTQRSLGLAPLAKPPAPTVTGNGKSRRRRKPMVRALKAARNLRAQATAGAGNSDSAGLQPTAPTEGLEGVQP